MNRLTQLDSVAVVLRQSDIDTDVIYPARFLLMTQREGLGRFAFHDWRFDEQGAERVEFAFNRTTFRDAQILVCGRNFGCGSSREQAPWALADLGVRCIVAESFGEIFESNCFRIGILPVRVSPGAWLTLAAAAEAGATVHVDLSSNSLRCESQAITIELPEWQRNALINGWDEIDLVIAQQSERIDAFERHQRKRLPWLYIPVN